MNTADLDIKFRYGQFIRFFFYHLLIYYAMPLSVILIPLFEWNLSIIGNLVIWPPNLGITYMVQTSIYFFNTITIILFLLYPDMNKICFSQIIIANLHILYRIFIISIRYGYMSPTRVHLIRKSKVNLKYVQEDLFIS